MARITRTPPLRERRGSGSKYSSSSSSRGGAGPSRSSAGRAAGLDAGSAPGGRLLARRGWWWQRCRLRPRPPRVLGKRGDRQANSFAAVVPVHVERVRQELEHGLAAAGDVIRLLAQQLADLVIGHSAPEREVEQRPVARVELAQSSWQAVGWHS